MVGNGEHIKCRGVCHNVPLMIQQHVFHVPLYLLPIQVADIVLAMAWLSTPGSALFDFMVSSMTFSHNDNKITLKGARPHFLPHH